MNVDNLRAVANLIELEDRFYYGMWTTGVSPDAKGRELIESTEQLNECGTTGCVAGWAAHLALREGFKCDATDIEDFAARYLGLNEVEASRLFFAHHIVDVGGNWLETTAVEIAKFLRQVADGEVTL